MSSVTGADRAFLYSRRGLPGKNAVGLIDITRELGKEFAEADADGHGYTELVLHIGGDFLRYLLPRAEKERAARHIKPAFVDAERLDKVGIAKIYLPREDGKLSVFFHMRRHADEPGTERARLPEGLLRFLPRFFGKLIFGEHYSVSLALAAADCHGHVAQLRSERTFDRGKEIIEVASAE